MSPRVDRAAVEPSVLIFWFLQALDVLTTTLGLHLGASEANIFITRVMVIGALPALLLAKGIALLLSSLALFQGRHKLLVKLNCWFAAVVTWNLCVIGVTTLR